MRNHQLISCTTGVAAIAAILAAQPCAAAPDHPMRIASGDTKSVRSATATTQVEPSLEPVLDPEVIFNELVERYRALDAYHDVVKIKQVTERDGDAPRELATAMQCVIDDGELSVQTPRSEARREVGLSLPVNLGPALKSVQQRYNLWLAPHMTLKFAAEPLLDFRSGIEQGFTPTEAESVTRNNKPMVHLELKSGDGLSEDAEATFDLYIDAESGLIERIESEERLADGASCFTTLEITPLMAVDDESAYIPLTPDENGEYGQMPDQAAPTAPPATIEPAMSGLRLRDQLGLPDAPAIPGGADHPG